MLTRTIFVHIVPSNGKSIRTTKHVKFSQAKRSGSKKKGYVISDDVNEKKGNDDVFGVKWKCQPVTLPLVVGYD